MKGRPRLSSGKILVVVIPLLFWVGCSTDTFFLKVQKEQSSGGGIARESSDTRPQEPSEERVAHTNAIEEAKPVAAAPRVEGTQRTGASPQIEEAQKEREQGFSPPDIEKGQQADAPASIESDKVVPNSRFVAEQGGVPLNEGAKGAQRTGASLEIEQEITDPGPTSVEPVLTVLSVEIAEGQERTASLPKLDQRTAVIPKIETGKKGVSPLKPVKETPGPRIEDTREGKDVIATPGIEEKATTLTPVEIEGSLPLSPEAQKQRDQEMLDSALEFCQASNDFWEQGDLYNAIDALDQAYSLILKVNPEDDSGLLQQKEDLRFTISKRIIEVYSSRFTVANGHNSVIPLVMNAHVQRALNLFKGKEKKFFLESYRRSGRYRPAILRALREAGLPEELSWLPLIESGFKIRALSRARALGLWQFVASTGYKFGLKRDTWVDERMDPERSTEAAIAYLKELHQIFGDWTTALAAYNCGEGKVLKCIRTQRVNYLDHFWDLYERLPMETAFYVPRFLAVLHILSDPEAHGFTLPQMEEEVETDTVTIDKQVHLKTISRHLGMPHTLLKEMNPSLRYSFTPNRAFPFKVPKGKGEVLLSKMDDLPVWNPPSPAYVVHNVRKGESLSVIARRYGTSVRAIMRLNSLRSSHFIRTGWKLKIPTGRKYRIPGAVPVQVSSVTDKGQLTQYVVQKGDSLWRIAERFGTTTKAIESANRLSDSYLRIGQVLMIPQDLTTTEEIKTKVYIVSKGDSPYLIATRHHMKLSQFLRINNLSPRSTIFPGQALLVREK
jgi:membrane-bound lytic murein transglycosylase D